MKTTNLMPLLDLGVGRDTMLEDVLRGLGGRPRRLPSKYFYDETGSRLFDEICALPEYYPTRTELGILQRHLHEMAACVGAGSCVFEIGSGSGLKTELLLEALDRPASYVPVDISCDALVNSAERLAERFPEIEIRPVCADFMLPLRRGDWLPRKGKRVVYFPGSTLGNLDRDEADQLLRSFVVLTTDSGAAKRPGGLLLGIDLQKDESIIRAAYNDAAGLTAKFNLNLLQHINRRLHARIPVDAFAHWAPYVRRFHRIEMHLVAQCDARFTIGEEEFMIPQGESILTEYSHKYALPDLRGRLTAAGWHVGRIWTDPQNYFAIIYCETGL